jgi:hypothetical protein
MESFRFPKSWNNEALIQVKKLKLVYQELDSFQQIDPGDKKRILRPAASKDKDVAKGTRTRLAVYGEYL